MSFRRVNRSKKVPGVKLRPAAPGALRDLRSPESAWTNSSAINSDEEASVVDTCPRPFKGFVLCATGINDKTSVFKLALELGAQSLNDLTDRVTHLIAEEPGSAKYRCALENRIPIMHPSWIEESYRVWLRGDDVDVSKSIEQHRLPPFAGVVLCVSGMGDANRRQEISRRVMKAGGSYVKVLERPVKVTHLLCGNASDAESEKVRYAEKFNSMGEARIHIVWEDWFWDSLRFGGRFDEDAYKVSNPPPPPRALPDVPAPSHNDTSIQDDQGLSSEMVIAEASAQRMKVAPPPGNEEDEEIASVKRVPEVKLHLWGSVLKSRGFEVKDGRLIRSPSKSQVAASQQEHALDKSPTRVTSTNKQSRRGTLKDLEDDQGDKSGPRSAISAFSRARSFAPPPRDASTPVGAIRQPFQRASTMSRTSSFLQRPVGSVQAQGGVSSDLPIASTSAVAGPSRSGSLAPVDDPAVPADTSELSAAARTLFTGMRFRALGEARCASVKRAIEECGGTWAGADDDGETDFTLVRLVSGSSLFRQERDAGERAKFRTECWVERCLFSERVCAPDEHPALAPVEAELPIPGADDVLLSFSGLDHAEACWVKRLLRALGIALAPNFSRRSTHLLCPSGVGAKADKAREWGTPIVDMSWLVTVSRTGKIPSAIVEQEHDVLDIQAVAPAPRPEGEWMASQPPADQEAPKVDLKGKGKAIPKAIDVTMADITNAEEAKAHARSLSYRDPTPESLAPGQAEQAEREDFGEPALLLGNMEAPDPDTSSANTQPTATSENDLVPIPSPAFQNRVPSSELPSPLRMPGVTTPRDAPTTPKKRQKLTRVSTKDLQARITTLLGKRPSEEDGGGSPSKLMRHESSQGMRPKPIHRSKSTMSGAGSSPAIQSPAGSFLALASPVPLPEPDLVPRSSRRREQPGSADEADTSMSADEGSGTGQPHEGPAYADPHQHVALSNLKHLLTGVNGAPQSRAEGSEWDLDLALEKELTLPQLPDLNADPTSTSSGKRPVTRAKRGRARKGARG